jgi:glycosyltransferase involved in cell wall biosynthesis
MFKNKKISVVIPAYNEEEHISKVIETLPDFVDSVIIVNDASTDKTLQVLNNYNGIFKKHLVIINRTVNQGVGAAIITGYKRAMEEGMDITAVMAGDAQMDPNELKMVISPIVEGKADYTKGNRLISRDAWKIIPKIRYFAGIFLSCLTKIVCGYWHVIDPQCGFTAISLEALNKIELDRIYKRYGFPNAILTELNIANLRVQNILITPIYHLDGKSGIKYEKIIFTLSFLLCRLFWHRMCQKYMIRDSHPLVLFYIFGITFFLTGTILCMIIFLIKSHISIGLTVIVFSAILTISGLQLILFAMLFDMEENKHLCIK